MDRSNISMVKGDQSTYDTGHVLSDCLLDTTIIDFIIKKTYFNMDLCIDLKSL